MIFISVAILLLVVMAVIIYSIISWRIPVTVLRFTGDKRRPLMIHRKARKGTQNGVTHLWVKGYKTPVRDFKAENYYPSPKTKFGGLILFEFEDGWLTPTRPAISSLGPKYAGVVEQLKEAGVVNFDFDPHLHKLLRLKMVDDIDADFVVNHLARINRQYQSTFDRFMALAPFGLIAFIGILGLVGFVLWLKEDPGNAAAACMNNVRPLLESMAERAVPPG